jgi:Fe-S-cluster containining protein
MVNIAQRTRAAILKKFRQTRMPRKIRSFAVRTMADPLFPAIFLLRNLCALQHEGSLRQSTPRKQRRLVLEVVKQRSLFFTRVKGLLKARGTLAGMNPSEEPHSHTDNKFAYCTHCGGCCEIASGLPEFPPEAAIPDEWMKIFGDGLGRNHRFCPFLWEARGKSLCSIHPWRSHPCRTFEKEECDFLLRDPAFAGLSERRALITAVKLMIRPANCQ